MAITIDWGTKVINVPKAYTTLVTAGPPQEIRSLDIDTFRLDLKLLEMSVDGMPFLDTHNHNPPVTVGGVILARVVEIINGYTITFEDGQYSVNLVGSNSNIADVTNVNQVSIRSANSAGLQDLSSLQAASFLGRVSIDTVNGQSGTLFPIGTGAQPSNNLTDAISIATTRGIRIFELQGSLVLDQDVEGYHIIGSGSHNLISLDANGFSLNNTVVDNITFFGTMTGEVQVINSKLGNLYGACGFFMECGMSVMVHVGAGCDALFVDCFSEVPGGSTPVLHCETGSTIQLRRYAGGIELGHFDATNVGTIDASQCHLILSDTCTGGQLVLRGLGNLTRNDLTAVNLIDTGWISDPDKRLQRPLVLGKSEVSPDLLVEP